MQERSTESNDLNEPDLPPTTHLYFFSSWLNKFEKTKLECYSVIFGISGISLIAFGLCILIIISTTYKSHLTNPMDCVILNITHTHIKLCESQRCRIFNYCIPYLCTIVFVRYYSNNLSYESKLFPINIHLNSSCSYEPSSCLSRSHIQYEQITFLTKIISNKSLQCCLHSLTQQPMICQNSTHYSISIISLIICFFIGLILILIGMITQLHLNNYFKSSHKPEQDFLDTILNFRFSNGTILSSIEKPTPVNYDILTQTLSHHNTPSTTKITRNDNLLLFDIDKENEIFRKECFKFNYQEQLKNEIIRQYQLDNKDVQILLNNIENDFKQQNHVILPKNSIEKINYLLETIDNLEIKFSEIHKQLSVSHPHVHFLIK